MRTDNERPVPKLKRECQHLRNVIAIAVEKQEAAEREIERLEGVIAAGHDPALLHDLELANKEVERLREKYNDLLYQVSIKYPDETRHETAKRYIQQAETSNAGPAQALIKEERDE